MEYEPAFAGEGTPDRGYLGIAHRDALVADDEKRLPEFIACFKHALLFTPRIVLADHMVFSRNFERAYRKDQGFRDLLRDDLIDIAYFEKFANGPAFTLVEHRKFREYLHRKQDPRYDPRNVDCPSVPFDTDLDSIQSRVGRLAPDASWRDPLFTAFAEQELDNATLKAVFGKSYTAYDVAFRRMREDFAAQNAPLGIVNFDEKHKAPGTENIFDYMTSVSSLSGIARGRLVSEYGADVAHAHRVLLLKAEMSLMRGVHAVLPSELRTYRTLALTQSADGALDEREALMRTLELDLSAVSVDVLASLSATEVLELRKAAQDFFVAMRDEASNPGSFDLICKTLEKYLRHLNVALALKIAPSDFRQQVKTVVKIAQGKVAGHTALLDGCIAVTFKIVSAITHSFYKHHAPAQDVGAALDIPFNEMERLTKSAMIPRALEQSLKHIPAHIALSPAGEQVMQYE